MKSITEHLNESKVSLDNGDIIEINVLVKKDKDSTSYHMYNLNGFNNAVKDAIKYNWDIFYEVTSNGKKVINQSLKEALNSLS